MACGELFLDDFSALPECAFTAADCDDMGMAFDQLFDLDSSLVPDPAATLPDAAPEEPDDHCCWPAAASCERSSPSAAEQRSSSPAAGSSSASECFFRQSPCAATTSHQQDGVEDVPKPPVVTTGFPVLDHPALAALKRNAAAESCSSHDDDDSDSGMQNNSQHAGSGGGSKRKLPVVDWRAISDPEERRKQRRLQKNRITAARSRERKKEQWAELEARFMQLQAENSRMKVDMEAMRTANQQLMQQLASLTRGASVPLTARQAELAVLLYLATVHLSSDAGGRAAFVLVKSAAVGRLRVAVASVYHSFFCDVLLPGAAWKAAAPDSLDRQLVTWLLRDDPLPVPQAP